IIHQQAQKLVPLIARESLPELAERQVGYVAEQKLPALITETARTTVNQELSNNVRPIVKEQTGKILSRSITVTVVLFIILLAAGIAMFLYGLNVIEQRMNERDNRPPVRIES